MSTRLNREPYNSRMIESHDVPFVLFAVTPNFVALHGFFVAR
jgi:hypothetical protein